MVSTIAAGLDFSSRNPLVLLIDSCQKFTSEDHLVAYCALLSHMKYWWSFARVIDNIVVDIIIVYDVGDIATTRGNSPPLNSLLL